MWIIRFEILNVQITNAEMLETPPKLAFLKYKKLNFDWMILKIFVTLMNLLQCCC